jgi:hypothetical protein
MSQRTVEMWLANDSGLYYSLQELINDAVTRGDTREDSERILADGIEELVDSEVGGTQGLVYDLVREALDDVDYLSLAESELADRDDSDWPVIAECVECGSDYDEEFSEGVDSGLCQACYDEAAEKAAATA